MKARRVEVANDRRAFPGRSRPSAPIGGAVGKVPGQQKSKAGRSARRDGALLTNCADCVVKFWLIVEPPVAGKRIPKQHRRIPPASLRPATPISQVRAVLAESSEHKAALQGIIGRHTRIAHEKTFQFARLPMLVQSRIRLRAAGAEIGTRLNRIVDGKGHAHFGLSLIHI